MKETSGLAVCATCGAGMTRTGTRRRQRSYSYCSCAGCHQKGKSVCKGRHIPLARLYRAIEEGIVDHDEGLGARIRSRGPVATH